MLISTLHVYLRYRYINQSNITLINLTMRVKHYVGWGSMFILAEPYLRDTSASVLNTTTSVQINNSG